MNWEHFRSTASKNTENKRVDQHSKIPILYLWMNWEKLCLNLNFTIENKMGNLHKLGCSHFKCKTMNETLLNLCKV